MPYMMRSGALQVTEPKETQEAEPVALTETQLQQLHTALDLQLDFNEARELLEICYEAFRNPIVVNLADIRSMIKEFLDRTA